MRTDVFQDFAGDARMAADGIVNVSTHHQKLAVSGSGGGVRIVHLFVGEVPRQAQVDIRNKRFLVPVLGDLLRRKRNQNCIVFPRGLKCLCRGISLVFRVGVGEKQPG